jgi:UDP-N-acetyl-alpha-D-quinovosamine dehydrogenase
VRVFVSGAAGFIGGALVSALRAQSHTLCQEEEGSEAIVHLANIAHTRATRSELWRVNVEGTAMAAERAVRAGARRFLYLSSAKAIAPNDAYGEAKREAERSLWRVQGVEKVVLRPPLVYGPGVKANFLALMSAIARGMPLPLASVRNSRSLIYVGNLVDGILRCLASPEAAGQTYAITDGAPVSTPTLCRAIGDTLGRPARLFPFPSALLEMLGGSRAISLTRSFTVDDGVIRRDLEWAPPYTFEQGLRATAEWYLAQAR